MAANLADLVRESLRAIHSPSEIQRCCPFRNAYGYHFKMRSGSASANKQHLLSLYTPRSEQKAKGFGSKIPQELEKSPHPGLWRINFQSLRAVPSGEAQELVDRQDPASPCCLEEALREKRLPHEPQLRYRCGSNPTPTLPLEVWPMKCAWF